MDIVGFVKKKIENKKLQKIKERERYQNYKRVLMEEEQRLKENGGKENLPTSFITLRHINKIYDNFVQAVYDFNLDIDKGEFVVFVGPSGCGKSTTLRMIAGLEDITTGDLIIDGVYSNNLEPKDRDTSMVFQNYALYPHLTVYENMAIGLRSKKFDKETTDERTKEGKKGSHLSKEEIDERIHKVADILQLNDYLKRTPRQLSGGQCQRVALGRAIVKDSKVFLMDEPLSNLDAKLRVQMRTEIIKLHKRLHATTIYVTHDQVEAMTMADRIVVMNKGVIQQIGKPEEIYDNPCNKFVAGFMGNPAMNLLEAKYDNGTITLAKDIAFSLTEDEIKKHDKFYENLLVEYPQELIDNDKHNTQRTEVLDKIAKEENLLKEGNSHEQKVAEKHLNKLHNQLKLIENGNARKNFLLKAIEDIKEIIKSKKHSITFGIRPEHISVNPEGKNLKINVYLNVVELLGNEYYFHFLIDKADVAMKTPKNQTYTSNNFIDLHINLDKKHLFDNISERKIL